MPFSGAGIRNAANFPSLSLEAYKVIEPYLSLAERMGKFAGQLVLGRISEVTITYSGAVAQEKVTAVTMALSHGLLTPIFGEDVNTINALNIMKERGDQYQRDHLQPGRRICQRHRPGYYHRQRTLFHH